MIYSIGHLSSLLPIIHHHHGIVRRVVHTWFHGKSTLPTWGNEAVKLIENVLRPISQGLNWVLRIIGVCIFSLGLHRVKNHQQKNHSPLATFFHFVSGAFIFSYAHMAAMFSHSLFGHMNGNKINLSFMNYVHQIHHAAHSHNFQAIALKEVVFALMLLVGLFSFVRGFMLLTYAGEQSGGGESLLTKSAIHIIAGLIAINLQSIFNIIQYMTSGTY